MRKQTKITNLGDVTNMLFRALESIDGKDFDKERIKAKNTTTNQIVRVASLQLNAAKFVGKTGVKSARKMLSSTSAA